MATETKNRFYTTREAANAVNLTERRIRQIHEEQASRGKMIGEKIGRDLLFSEEDIEAIRNLPDRRRKSEKNA